MAKTALITGASGKLGRLIAQHLAGRGYNLVLQYQGNAAAAERAGAACRDAGADFRLLRQDLSDIAAVEEFMQAARACFDGLDLVVNAAARFERGGLAATTPELAREIFAVNLLAPLEIMRWCAGSGSTAHVVNLLDSKIFRTAPAHFAYVLSKKALAEATRMAAAVSGPGLRINGIAPGLLVATPEEGPDLAALAARAPLGTYGTVADLGAALDFLCDSTGVTGQIIALDGGMHLA